jgi:hypothetical protein
VFSSVDQSQSVTERCGANHSVLTVLMRSTKKGRADEKYTLDKILQGHVLGRETRDTDTHEAGPSDGGRDLAQYF